MPEIPHLATCTNITRYKNKALAKNVTTNLQNLKHDLKYKGAPYTQSEGTFHEVYYRRGGLKYVIGVGVPLDGGGIVFINSLRTYLKGDPPEEALLKCLEVNHSFRKSRVFTECPMIAFDNRDMTLYLSLTTPMSKVNSYARLARSLRNFGLLCLITRNRLEVV